MTAAPLSDDFEGWYARLAQRNQSSPPALVPLPPALRTRCLKLTCPECEDGSRCRC